MEWSFLFFMLLYIRKQLQCKVEKRTNIYFLLSNWNEHIHPILPYKMCTMANGGVILLFRCLGSHLSLHAPPLHRSFIEQTFHICAAKSLWAGIQPTEMHNEKRQEKTDKKERKEERERERERRTSKNERPLNSLST